MMIRHPAGVISSVSRLGWKGKLERWHAQPQLVQDLLAPYADRLRAAAENPDALDDIDRGIIAWNCIYSAVRRFREEHPDWCFVRYEDAADDPIGTFRRMYEFLELRFDGSVASTIERFSSPSNPERSDPSSPHGIRLASRAASRSWHDRLSRANVERIREGTKLVWPAFYGSQEWDDPP
jgi:hypothetical protein